MPRLPDKVVFITGSTGIAAATAELAVREGARVFIATRTEANGRALCDALAPHGEAEFLAADLVREGAATEAVRRCVARFGRVDAAFNVAGISGRRWGDGPLHECSEEGWDVTLDTNVKSMFLTCRALLQQMLRQDPAGRPPGLRGNILNMASVLGFSPEPRHFGTHAYAASKGAILGMSKSMAAYYAPHKIRINVIAPSLIRTPMSQRAQTDPVILNLLKTKQPLVEGFIEAEDVARAALFLLSDDAAVITGDTLTVDAGWCVGT